MAFDGSGTFLLPAGFDLSNGTTADGPEVQDAFEEVAAALSTCMTKDGQSTVTADIPMANHKFTGLSAGSSAGHSLRYEQLFTSTLTLTDALTVPGILTVAGGQIVFPSSQDASSDANTLDDYEEGTWTPSITFGGGNTGITYHETPRNGSYTKIGDRVLVDCAFQLLTKGSSTGTAEVTGLPFEVGNDASSVCAIRVNVLAAATDAHFVGMFVSGSTTLQISKLLASSTNAEVLTNSDFSNTTSIIFSGHYRA